MASEHRDGPVKIARHRTPQQDACDLVSRLDSTPKRDGHPVWSDPRGCLVDAASHVPAGHGGRLTAPQASGKDGIGMSCIIIVDTETTGVDPVKDHVIEVAFCTFDLQANAIAECSSTLIHAQQNDKARAINGISQGLLDEHGGRSPNPSFAISVELIELKDELGPLFKAIVAHQAPFDRQWFTGEAKALPWICSMRDIEWPFRERAGSCSLEKLALAHGVAVLPGHRAIHDVLTLARVFEAVGRSEGVGPLERLIDRALRPRIRYQAIVTYDRNQQAKELGFQWDAVRKMWTKEIALDDVGTFPWPFRIVPVLS